MANQRTESVRSDTPQVIEANATYSRTEFMRRTGLRESAMRSARRAGLKTIYAHGKAFVRGSDWLAYLDRIGQQGESQPD